MWQPIAIFLTGLALVLGLFFFKLDSLTNGYAGAERQTIAGTTSIKTILDNPINAPYKVATYMADKFEPSILAARIVSAVVAVLSILLFYRFSRHFVKPLAAVLGSLLFATSTAVLNNGRLASANIMLLTLFLLLAAGYRLRFNVKHNLSWLIAAFALGISIYTPGIAYFIVLGVIWQYKAMKRDFDPVKKVTLLLCAVIFTAFIAPLVYGLTKNPDLLKDYFLIPASFPNIKDLLLRILAVPAGVLAFAPKNPTFRLGRQALLDAFSVVMMLLGIYTLLRHYKLDRLKLLLAIFVLGTLLTAIAGDFEYSFALVPFIYFIVTLGLNTFLKFWHDVFPFNPLARSMAVFLLVSGVVISANFQTRRYFIAWPHNHETKAVFTPTK